MLRMHTVPLPFPPLGRGDHDVICLSPKFVPLVQRQPEDCEEVDSGGEGCTAGQLGVSKQGQARWTTWEGHQHHDRLHDRIQSITLCEHTTLPARIVSCFPNKPWITSDLKILVKNKKKTFRAGDRGVGEGAAGPQGEAEGVQGLLQEEAGGQAPAEQQKEGVDWSEGNHWVEGEGLTTSRQRGEGQRAELFLQQVQVPAACCPPFRTVLSPFLFPFSTSDIQSNSGSGHLQKFRDDSAVVGCVRDEQEDEFRALLGDFVEGSGESPASQHGPDQGDGDGLDQEEDSCTASSHPGRGQKIHSSYW